MRVAFVGAGRRSVESAAMLARSGLGAPVGVWSRTSATASVAAKALGVSAYEHVETMIEREQPDLVAIMTHPVARVELVSTAVSSGARAILVEKPIALTLNELERLESAAGSAFVMVNTQYQWMAHWREILSMIKAGGMGTIRSIRVSVGVDILEQGPHALSLAMAVASAAALPPPTWVLAASDGSIDFGGVSVPANTSAVFDLGDARLTLLAGDCAPPVPGETVRGFQQQSEITFDEGSVWISLNQGGRVFDSRGGHSVTTSWEVDDQTSQTGLFAAIAGALDSPENQATFPTRLSESSRQARMLFGAMRSAAEGKRLSL